MKEKTLFLFFLMSVAVATAQTVHYTASTGIIANPERGLQKYSITGSDYATVVGANNLSASMLTEWKADTDKVTMVFRYFLLSDFMNTDINSIYLDNIQGDFDSIRHAGLKVIVRFSYSDAQGSGPQQPSKAQILAHINQLAPVLQNNKDVIFSHQAGFIGTWGEWYYTNSTEFGDEDAISPAQWLNRKEVLDAMLVATPAEIPIQVRYVGIKTTLYGSTPLSSMGAYQNTPSARIGFFNDAFLNDWGDQGTYSVTDQCEDPVGTPDYDFLINETQYLPMTGETNGVNPCDGGLRTTGDNAIYEMELTHWTTLNRDYHPDFWSQIDSADYQTIVQKLGYRYVLDSSILSLHLTNFDLSLYLTNTGFAQPVKQRSVYLVLKDTLTNIAVPILINTDLRNWGSTVIIDQNFFPNLAGTFKLYLWLPDSDPTLATRPEYCIQLANDSTWDASTGYNDLSIIVTLTISLPVELTTFEARPTGSTVALNWQTVSEKNNSHFEIERSANTRDWTTIGSVNGAGGPGQTRDYQHFDQKPLAGLQFYRLKQIDRNGEYTLSKIVSVYFNTKNTEPLKVYPNPASDRITIELPGFAEKDPLNLFIINLNGQVVSTKQLLPLATQTVDVSDLPSGQYMLYSLVNGQTWSVPFVKQ